MKEGLALQRSIGGRILQQLWLALQVEAYIATGRFEEAWIALDEALTIRPKHGDRYWEAELYRLKGELLLVRDALRSPVVEAEASLYQALAIARHQQAKSWELRAAMSLARLWQQQGKRAEAHELLAPIYSWFTEGFDTPDLQEARALLDTLA